MQAGGVTRRWIRRCSVVASLGAALGACENPTASALVDLPALELVNTPAARGGSVLVRVVNTTDSDVTLHEPACTAHVVELVGAQWRRAEEPVPCVALSPVLAPGEAHPFSTPTPPGRGGRFRVVVYGANAHGEFEVRSSTFTVE